MDDPLINEARLAENWLTSQEIEANAVSNTEWLKYIVEPQPLDLGSKNCLKHSELYVDVNSQVVRLNSNEKFSEI